MPKVERYDVSFVKREGERDYWIKIGAAFPGNDGKITLKLDAFPLNHIGWDGRLILFPKETE